MYAMGESTCELTKEEGGGGGRRGREESDAARLDSISTVSHLYHREKLTHFKSRLKLHDLSQNELELKAALYFHICNPLKRWRVEKLVPYKLVLQVFKTFLLVAQVFHLPFLSLSSLLSFSKLLFIHHLILFFCRSSCLQTAPQTFAPFFSIILDSSWTSSYQGTLPLSRMVQ